MVSQSFDWLKSKCDNLPWGPEPDSSVNNVKIMMTNYVKPYEGVLRIREVNKSTAC